MNSEVEARKVVRLKTFIVEKLRGKAEEIEVIVFTCRME